MEINSSRGGGRREGGGRKGGVRGEREKDEKGGERRKTITVRYLLQKKF